MEVGDAVFLAFVEVGVDEEKQNTVGICIEKAKVLQIDDTFDEIVLDRPIMSLKGQRVFSTASDEADRNLFSNEADAVCNLRKVSEIRSGNLMTMIETHQATMKAANTRLQELGIE